MSLEGRKPMIDRFIVTATIRYFLIMPGMPEIGSISKSKKPSKNLRMGNTFSAKAGNGDV